jgi:hypothetical protein
MTGIRWGLVHLLLRGLAPEERDAVLGDMIELRSPVGSALRDAAGLLVRRQAAGLASWQGLLTLLAVVVPLAMLIGLLSRFYAEGSAINAFIYVDNWSSAVLDSPGGRKDLVGVVLTQLAGFATLGVWSWMMGFMIGSLSRATAWVNGCVFALVLFGEFLAVPQYHHPGNAAVFESMAYQVVLPLSIRAYLVLGPVVWGMRDGARRTVPATPVTIVLVVIAAVLTARASRWVGFAANGGWWPLWSAWPLAVQAAVWLPLVHLIGASVWHRRAGTMVQGS